FTVVGVPASMTLAADPATLTCDGTATSKVSATIVDAAGNPVAAGNQVTFSVKVLGSANPVVAKTDDKGVASSVITPLSGGQAGVPVVVSVGTLSQSTLVSCANAAATTPTPGTGTTPPPTTGGGGTGITGPNTGTGDGTVAGGSNWMLFAALSALGLLAGSAMVWTGARARRR
ncbi:MAG TPA: invasin domain 3-containing protein, partial [Thermomicrobiales bacterium]|nr:invasin domain 3-containing protein [Thermomicrobiales bacterium]